MPALLGLKGNLEMTFSSRLSTSASLGDLNNSVTRRATIKANLAVMQVWCFVCVSSPPPETLPFPPTPQLPQPLQVQAILVGFAAALFSVVMGVVVHHEFSILHTMLLLGASMATASIASGLLGLVGLRGLSLSLPLALFVFPFALLTRTNSFHPPLPTSRALPVSQCNHVADCRVQRPLQHRS